jgi:hypothetical protein
MPIPLVIRVFIWFDAAVTAPKKAFDQGGELHEPVLLPVGINVIDVAQAARRAVIAFLELDSRNVDAVALTTWLKGPYASALALASRSTLPPPSSVPRPKTDEHLAQIEGFTNVRANVSAAKQAIEKVLVAFLRKPDLSIAYDMVKHNVVQRVTDDEGRLGYAPLAPKVPHLPVRVLSLVLADMLTRPDDLRQNLSAEGSGVEFRTRHVSAVVPRRGTTPYFG